MLETRSKMTLKRNDLRCAESCRGVLWEAINLPSFTKEKRIVAEYLLKTIPVFFCLRLLTFHKRGVLF